MGGKSCIKSSITWLGEMMRSGVISNKQNCAAGRRDYNDNTAPADDEKNKEHNLPCLLREMMMVPYDVCQDLSWRMVVLLMMWRELLLFGWALLIKTVNALLCSAEIGSTHRFFREPHLVTSCFRSLDST